MVTHSDSMQMTSHACLYLFGSSWQTVYMCILQSNILLFWFLSSSLPITINDMGELKL